MQPRMMLEELKERPRGEGWGEAGAGSGLQKAEQGWTREEGGWKLDRTRGGEDHDPWVRKRPSTQLGDLVLSPPYRRPQSACNAGDPGSIPDSGRSPGEGNSYPLQFLSWRIPWTKEPGRLQSMELQRVGHDWASFIFTFTNIVKWKSSGLTVKHVRFRDRLFEFMPSLYQSFSLRN